MTRPRLDDIQVGDELPARSFAVRRGDLIRYAGASGDDNVIHWNERVAKSVGLPNVIAHGMYTMALGGRYVTDWAGDPASVVEYRVRFANPVVVPDDDRGAEIVMSGRVESLREAERAVVVLLEARCGGEKLLSGARAVVRLP